MADTIIQKKLWNIMDSYDRLQETKDELMNRQIELQIYIQSLFAEFDEKVYVTCCESNKEGTIVIPTVLDDNGKIDAEYDGLVFTVDKFIQFMKDTNYKEITMRKLLKKIGY